MRLGISHEQIHQSCKIDPWFIDKLQEIIDIENKIQLYGLPKDQENFRLLKSYGFSDARLANLIGEEEHYVRQIREDLSIKPVFKHIDTVQLNSKH